MIIKKGKGIAGFDLLSELRKVEYEGSHEKSERWSLLPKDETWSVAENNSSNNHQRGQCQQHQIILLSHKK